MLGQDFVRGRRKVLLCEKAKDVVLGADLGQALLAGLGEPIQLGQLLLGQAYEEDTLIGEHQTVALAFVAACAVGQRDVRNHGDYAFVSAGHRSTFRL